MRLSARDERRVLNPGTILRAPAGGVDVRVSGTFGVLELPSRAFRVHRVGDGSEIEPAGRGSVW